MRNILRKFRFFKPLPKRGAAKRTPDVMPPMPVSGSPVPLPEAVRLDSREQQLDRDNAPIDSAVDTANRNHGTSHLPVCMAPPTLTLATLPAELRRQILFHLSNLHDLRALVLASPVFYQQYLLDRKALLGRGLKAALGNLLVDAYAVQSSASLYDSVSPGDEPEPETTRMFLDTYVALRTATPDIILEECCTEEDLMNMAAFRVSLARPLSLWCAARFLHNLDPSLEVGSLSATESIRL